MKDNNIMFIICGSNLSLVTTQALNYSSPLYGRRTAQIKLMPIEFTYYNEFYDNIKGDQSIPFYSVTGGVPKYIEMFNSKKDLFVAIK